MVVVLGVRMMVMWVEEVEVIVALIEVMVVRVVVEVKP